MVEITVNETRLYVHDSGPKNGEKPTLLFLHYYDGSSQTWNPVIACLEDDFRCVAPDLRGFGASAASDDYSIGANAQDVISLVAALGLTRFVLIGHSMGGKIALAAAARFSEQNGAAGLVGLVLVAPSPPTPEPLTDEERDRLRDSWGDFDRCVDTVQRIAKRPLAPTVVESTARDALRASQAAHNAWLTGGSQENIADAATKIRVPVLIIAGECDAGFGPDLLQTEVADRLSSARLLVVPGAGHLLPLEAPDDIANYIREVAV